MSLTTTPYNVIIIGSFLLEAEKLNLFIFDENHTKNAEYHCDKHVVKMILEAAQMICTVSWILNVIGDAPDHLNKEQLKVVREAVREQKFDIPYKPTHINHPCVIWARKSRKNFMWLVDYICSLQEEYCHRYKKEHKSYAVVASNIDLVDTILKIKATEQTEFAQAMPDKYKNDDAIKAYRDYFIGEKSNIAAWKNRGIPHWYKEKQCIVQD